MIKYIDSKTGKVLGEYPPSNGKSVFVFVERDVYEYLEQIKREQKEKNDVDSY